jgi:hypothetical protein
LRELVLVLGSARSFYSIRPTNYIETKSPTCGPGVVGTLYCKAPMARSRK